MLKTVMAIGTALLLFGSSAMAQGAARACAADIKALCAGVEPGQGRIASCVKERFKDLSAPCQNLLAKSAAAAKACAADIKKDCADKRRRSAIVACLKSTLANLSDGCKSAIAQSAAGKGR